MDESFISQLLLKKLPKHNTRKVPFSALDILYLGVLCWKESSMPPLKSLVLVRMSSNLAGLNIKMFCIFGSQDWGVKSPYFADFIYLGSYSYQKW